MRYLLALLALAMPAAAQDFSEGSEAKSWNLYAEQPARFEAKVVDILCEVTGDCPENCGDGTRQLGLVRSADNVLVFPNKNSQPAFTGAAVELLPFCGQDVEVDGLLIEDEDLGARNIYLVQTIRRQGDAEWTKANRWTKVWADTHPDAAGKGPWFRRDPRVNAEIAREGYFGLGADKDAAIKDELFE
ncbi:hypothetical protein [Oceaniglobus trochenteri]|uniref:hypothetical protein n=1 Tax=Oceaniglobus trochenteri TaxID=2763260 RepID=UPI001D000A21|nr:hypothetical protein [Oceaniglobus trochenteri]